MHFFLGALRVKDVSIISLDCGDLKDLFNIIHTRHGDNCPLDEYMSFVVSKIVFLTAYNIMILMNRRKEKAQARLLSTISFA